MTCARHRAFLLRKSRQLAQFAQYLALYFCSVYVRLMSKYVERPLIKPLAESLPAAVAAFEAVLRAAMAVGAAPQKSPERTKALAVAKRARDTYNVALEELRRSERLEGREGAARWLESTLVGIPSSLAAPGGMSAGSLLREVQHAIGQLKHAKW